MNNKARVALVHFIGLMIARGAFFGMNPLAIGYFTAAYLAKAGGSFAFISILIGIASIMPTLAILKYLLTMLIVIVIFESPRVKQRQIPTMIQMAAAPVVLGIFTIMEAYTTSRRGEYILLAVLEMIIAFVAAGIFKYGIDYWLNSPKGNKMSNEQAISMAFMVAIIVYATPNFTNAYIAPVETVVYFVLIYFTYKYGAGQGAITGAICGLTLSLRGAPISDVAQLCMMGIIPAIFRELGRVPTATIFMITAAMMGIVFEGMALSLQQIGALASSLLVFLLLPKNMVYRSDFDLTSKTPENLATQNVRNIAKSRMKDFSEAFLKLSRALNTTNDRQTSYRTKVINRIFEDISEKLCKNCKECSNCWDYNFEETYQAACQVFDVAERNGVVLKEDIPIHFADNCICADQFVEETNRGFEIAKLNQIWLNRMAESREIIAEQLKEVSSVIKDMSGNLYNIAEVSKTEEQKVIRKLKGEQIHTKSINIVERNEKRKEVHITAACKGGRCITAKEVALIISDALGVRMCVSEASKSVITRDYDDFIFLEDTKFKMLTGMSRAMKESVSGDNFSVLKLESGEMMIALSDGMGTGKKASEESEAVIALLEQLIEAGIKTETAIKLINSGLVLKSDNQSFSTIDMSVINLFTGVCKFVKLGAATTFIKRDNWVETISSTSMPIGMLQSVDFDMVSKKLYEGDIIIMVTDGVLDCIQEEDKEAYMEKMIMEIKSNNPQEIANRILEKTLEQRNYNPIDDMTVITGGIWLK